MEKTRQLPKGAYCYLRRTVIPAISGYTIYSTGLVLPVIKPQGHWHPSSAAFWPSGRFVAMQTRQEDWETIDQIHSVSHQLSYRAQHSSNSAELQFSLLPSSALPQFFYFLPTKSRAALQARWGVTLVTRCVGAGHPSWAVWDAQASMCLCVTDMSKLLFPGVPGNGASQRMQITNTGGCHLAAWTLAARTTWAA